MRHRILILIVAISLFASAVAAADSSDQPSFTADELQVIAHDPTLCALIGSDPGAVRDYFDRTGDAGPPDTATVTPCTKVLADPNSQKGSSEAIWELNQLLKRVGPPQPPQPQPPQPQAK